MRNLQEMKQYCHINRKFHFLEYCIYLELFHKQNITTQPLDKLIDQVNAILALIFFGCLYFLRSYLSHKKVQIMLQHAANSGNDVIKRGKLGTNVGYLLALSW